MDTSNVENKSNEFNRIKEEIISDFKNIKFKPLDNLDSIELSKKQILLFSSKKLKSSEFDLLRYLGVNKNGVIWDLTKSDKLGYSYQTLHNAKNHLQEWGLIYECGREKSDKNNDKNLYEITQVGFLYLYSQIINPIQIIPNLWSRVSFPLSSKSSYNQVFSNDFSEREISENKKIIERLIKKGEQEQFYPNFFKLLKLISSIDFSIREENLILLEYGEFWANLCYRLFSRLASDYSGSFIDAKIMDTELMLPPYHENEIITDFFDALTLEIGTMGFEIVYFKLLEYDEFKHYIENSVSNAKDYFSKSVKTIEKYESSCKVYDKIYGIMDN